MNMSWSKSLFFVFFLVSAMLFTACEGPSVCAGLNNRTGSANSSKKVRKGNRGGYKSPRELDARDRSKKRNRNRSRNSMRKSRGGGNTTGKGKASFGGGINIGGTFHIGGGNSADGAKH
jgi:hypothetical protein